MLKKENNKGKIIITILIIAILVASTAGFLMTSEDDGNYKTYKDYKIYQAQESRYEISVNDQLYPIDYLPEELENIAMPNFQLSDIVYILYNQSDGSLLNWQMRKMSSVLLGFGVRVNPACKTEENCPNIPVITCKDRPSIIELRLGNELKLFKEDNCLVLQGTQEDINKLADKIDLALLNVIK